MNGKIDEQGCLWIERGGVWQKQYCMFFTLPDGYEEPKMCGHNCPLFGEPKEPSLCVYVKDQWKEGIAIDICQGRQLIFEQFTDERSVK